MAEPASKLTNRLYNEAGWVESFGVSRSGLVALLHEAVTALEQADEALAREIELRIEDEPVAVRRQAERADRAETRLEQAEQALREILEHEPVDACPRCARVAREALAALGGLDG